MFARHRNQEPDLVQEQESPTADSEAGDEHMPSFEVKHDSRLSRGISRARAYAAARPKRHFVGAFAVLLGVVRMCWAKLRMVRLSTSLVPA